MKTSEKILEIALEVENLLEETGYDFNESLDQKFADIRREVEALESRLETRKRSQGGTE